MRFRIEAFTRQWTAIRPRAYGIVTVVMAALGAIKLGDEFRRLLFERADNGAIDLILRDTMVQAWFAGRPVYSELAHAIFPPASYPLLWPLSGWLPTTPSRWFWAATTLVAIALILRLVLRDCGAVERSRQWFIALLLLSMNATGVVIGNGQLLLHLMPPLLASVLWLRTEEASWRRDLLITACFVFALSKPSVSAPFFWLLLCVRGGTRPSVLVTSGYLSFTVLAAQFQGESLVQLFAGWIANAGNETGGYAEINSLMRSFGWSAISPWASLALLSLWGVWVYGHRDVDRWIQVGATALFARFWTYHRVYDDVLVFLAEIALVRIAAGVGGARRRDRLLAEVLLLTTAVVMLCPARLVQMSPPLGSVFRGGHALVWAGLLVFLMVLARRERRKDASSPQ